MFKFLFITTLLAFVTITAIFASEDDIFVATNENYNELITNNEFVFIEFYAPWCNHCKNLAPTWQLIASKLKNHDSGIVIAKLDATEHTEPVTTYDIDSYPTLILFHFKQAIIYKGDRSEKAIMNWIEKKINPASILLSDQASLDTFKSKNVIIAYISEDESILFKNWMNAASDSQLDDFNFAHVQDKVLSGNYKNTAVIYNEDKDAIVFKGELSTSKIIKWIKAVGYPIYEEISQSVWQRSQDTNMPLAVMFIDNRDDVQMAMMKELATRFSPTMIFSFAPIDTHKALAQRWGASGNFIPTAIVSNWKGTKSPTMSIFNEDIEDELNISSASAFIEKALIDKYESYIKSEPIPDDNNGPVTVVVGKNFKELVIDSDKDVFVDFYAPWCGHCKKLAPIFEELGEKFSNVDNVMIAKIDLTTNNLPPDIEITGYPTIILFQKGKHIHFNGERDLDGLTNFIIEHSTEPIDLLSKNEL